MKKPLTLADPVIQSTTSQGDDAPLVDYLQEAEATLADVLALYAGAPPDFADGIRQSALALFLKHTEPHRDRHKEVARLWHPTPSAMLPPHVAAMRGYGGKYNFAWPPRRCECVGVKAVTWPVFPHDCGCGLKPDPSSLTGYRVMGTIQRVYLEIIRMRAAHDDSQHNYWVGECKQCHTLYWACSPTPRMSQILKHRVLKLLPEAPLHIRIRLCMLVTGGAVDLAEVENPQ